MNHDIKLPGPDGWVNRANYYCPANRGCSAPYDGIPKFSANQLRAAVLADRAERASAADLELPSLAIRDGRRCVDRLDGYYDFECEGGPLRMCVDWDVLKRAFEHLCMYIERAHHIVEKESGK